MAKRVEAKIILENLKKGWTTEEFCSYLGFSASDFSNALANSFNSKIIRSINAQLIQNEKNKKKLNKARTIKSSKEFAVLPPIIQQPKECKKTLEELKDEESTLKQEIFELEVKKKNLFTKKHDFYLSLSSEKNELNRILKLLNEREMTVNGLIKNLEKLENELKSLNSEISSKQKNLSKIASEIKSATKVSILFYIDGSFEFDGAKPEVTISEKDVSDMVETFLKNPDFENLTIKQIKGLAKLKIILDNSKINYTITFESKEIENAFSLIV